MLLWEEGSVGWEGAERRARDVVRGLSLEEKGTLSLSLTLPGRGGGSRGGWEEGEGEMSKAGASWRLGGGR